MADCKQGADEKLLFNELFWIGKAARGQLLRGRSARAGGSGLVAALGDDRGDGAVVDRLPHDAVRFADHETAAVVGEVDGADGVGGSRDGARFHCAVPGEVFDSAFVRPACGRLLHAASEAADRDRETHSKLVDGCAVHECVGVLEAVDVCIVTDELKGDDSLARLGAGDVRLHLGNVGGSGGEGERSKEKEHGGSGTGLRPEYSKY